MARISQGDCVGIYHWRGNRLRVHNGRLIGARYGQTWVPYVDTSVNRKPDEVLFAHWKSAGEQPFQERHRLTHIQEVRLTPDLPANNDFQCAEYRTPGLTGEIRPGAAVGICYRGETGERHIANGRYLFWRDGARQPHCVLQEGDAPHELFYYRWIIRRNGSGQVTALVPEIISRRHVCGILAIQL